MHMPEGMTVHRAHCSMSTFECVSGLVRPKLDIRYTDDHASSPPPSPHHLSASNTNAKGRCIRVLLLFHQLLLLDIRTPLMPLSGLQYLQTGHGLPTPFHKSCRFFPRGKKETQEYTVTILLFIVLVRITLLTFFFLFLT
jgi:hypothetical protein